MNTFTELNKNDVVNEKMKYAELFNQNSIKKQVVDTIIALVNQANTIEKEKSFSENRPTYNDISDPTIYINTTDEKAKEAKKKYEELKIMKQSFFYTIGRNKAKVEKSQEVLGEIIDAVDNNANATKALFNAQTEMAEFSKKLYGIGLMGIAANRIVVREVKLRLENASKEELSKLARQELESVIKELQQQLNIENKIEENHKKVLKENKEIREIIKEKKDLLNKELYKIKEQYKLLILHVNKNNDKLEETSKIINDNKELFIKELNMIKEQYNSLLKQVDDNNTQLKSYLDIHDKRLDLLENKTLFDSLAYKIILAIVVFMSLVLSIVKYLL